MPAYKCRCEQWISYGTIPSRDEYLFISDEEYNGIEGLVDAERLYLKMKAFLKCPRCSRLWIFWHGYAAEPEEFVLGDQTQDKPRR